MVIIKIGYDPNSITAEGHNLLDALYALEKELSDIQNTLHVGAERRFKDIEFTLTKKSIEL